MCKCPRGTAVYLAIFAISGSACSSVLAIPELLENILSFLPAKTISRVQCVSQSWKSTIARSVSIQEKLFLRCLSKPHEIWGLHNENHGLAVRPFLHQTGDLPKEGRVPLDTFYQYPASKSFEYFALSVSDGWHCIHLRRTEQTKDDHDLILPVSLNPTLKAPVNTFKPFPLQQHRPSFQADERGIFVNLPTEEFPSNGYEEFQLAQYTGTLENLEKVADMYVSDPPCTRAMMHAMFFCETTESSPVSGRIIARLCWISLHFRTGLKMGDILRVISHEPCRSYHLMKSPYEHFHPDSYKNIGGAPGWDDGLTVVKLQSVLQDHYQCLHMRLSPVSEMDVRLLDNVGGLRPIVPTVVEWSAVVDK